jgi:mono/diheme cytochrome c family protein
LQRQFRELSESPRRPVPRPSTPATEAVPASRELFQQHCAECHGADGTGSQVRDSLPEIPNFTDASWQARRTNVQLMAGILKGKGADMPPWRRKISTEQARGLVTYIRAFRGNKKAVPRKPAKSPASRSVAHEAGAQRASLGALPGGAVQGWPRRWHRVAGRKRDWAPLWTALAAIPVSSRVRFPVPPRSLAQSAVQFQEHQFGLGSQPSAGRSS